MLKQRIPQGVRNWYLENKEDNCWNATFKSRDKIREKENKIQDIRVAHKGIFFNGTDWTGWVGECRWCRKVEKTRQNFLKKYKGKLIKRDGWVSSNIEWPFGICGHKYEMSPVIVIVIFLFTWIINSSNSCLVQAKFKTTVRWRL